MFYFEQELKSKISWTKSNLYYIHNMWTFNLLSWCYVYETPAEVTVCDSQGDFHINKTTQEKPLFTASAADRVSLSFTSHNHSFMYP